MRRISPVVRNSVQIQPHFAFLGRERGVHHVDGFGTEGLLRSVRVHERRPEEARRHPIRPGIRAKVLETVCFLCDFSSMEDLRYPIYRTSMYAQGEATPLDKWFREQGHSRSTPDFYDFRQRARNAYVEFKYGMMIYNFPWHWNGSSKGRFHETS